MSPGNRRGDFGKGSPFVLPLLLLTGLTACDQGAPTADDAAAEIALVQAEAVTLAALPLKRGYYVASDTPCDKASNATTTLLRRNGLGGSRDFCEFKRIEQTGPNTYRVTEACGDLQDDTQPETSVVAYTLQGETAFSTKRADGWTHSARYCAQSTMPPEWRENDISDATN